LAVGYIGKLAAQVLHCWWCVLQRLVSGGPICA
jgi:hypothetical protein